MLLTVYITQNCNFQSCSKILTEFFEEIPKGQQISVFAKIENERIPLKAKLCNPYLVKFVVPSK